MDLLDRLRQPLAARYTVEEEIGRGGMAVVFRAVDLKHERRVAIKVLRPELSASLGADRFLREIRIAAQLQHPHIAPLYDSGEAGGLLYYVMPYLDGETLRERLQREGPLQLEEALRITADVAKALDHAHAMGVVHRDVKPENVWLADSEALVLDFGIARALSEAGVQLLTDSGVTVGTPEYMSPEQGSGALEIDGRSDIYSLACATFEMLAGEPPFTGPTPQAVIARQVSQEPPSLRVVRPTIPHAVERAIERALAKVPADRFATATAFAARLGGGVQAEERGSWARRHPIVSMLVAAGGVAGVWLAWSTGLEDVFRRRPAGLDPSRIAVLYFTDQSSDQSLGHIAEGLTEDLIDELSEVEALDVISSSRMRAFAGRAVPPDSIARVLSVGSLVEGSVTRSRDWYRVGVRLVDPVSGSLRASHTIERQEGELFELQDELAAEVARLLRVSLGQEIQLRERRARAGNAAAWALVQRAEGLRRNAEQLDRLPEPGQAARSLRIADSLLAEAERIAPDWVEPTIQRGWVEAARVRVAEGSQGRARALGDATPAPPLASSASFIARGVEHADRALARDPRSAEAFELRGMLRYKQWQNADPQESSALLEAAERDLSTAVSLDPRLARAWADLSRIHRRNGDFVAAEHAAGQALRADAYLQEVVSVINAVFQAALERGDWRSAGAWCDSARTHLPDDLVTAECRLTVLGYFGDTEADVAEAWDELRRVEQRDTANVLAETRRTRPLMVAAVLARAGLADSARAVMRRNRAAITDTLVRQKAGFYEALVYALLGEPDSALARLAEYLEGYPRQRNYVASHRSFQSLRGRPAFEELVGAADPGG